jgi:hypothetical protein
MTQEFYSGELCGCMIDDSRCEWPTCCVITKTVWTERPNVYDDPTYDYISVWHHLVAARYGSRYSGGVYPAVSKSELRHKWFPNRRRVSYIQGERIK